MPDSTTSHARVYWITWGVLLALTVVMLAADGASIPRTGFLVLMLGAMAIKATLIAGNFMHLRQERVGIVLTVVVGLFAMAAVLYVLIAPDARRIHHMVSGLERGGSGLEAGSLPSTPQGDR
jgi:cytochrome c oxidase subunit IV